MPDSCVLRSREAHVAAPARTLWIAIIAGTALMLCGCSTFRELRGIVASPPSKPIAHQTPSTARRKEVPIPTKPRRQARKAHENKEPERVASIDPKSLIGLAPSAVERLLGTPSHVSKVDPSLVWTYAGQGCTFRVFFYPDIKTTAFHALKYASSGDERANCIRSILTVKSNGPS